ncbi:hypothetical protein LSUE1_G000885 [Lachnellula suecica]|uniref:Small secreted protein n=1 Tax=Lachnellula suecica TaxID=602035 RepID=A0A8T9CEW2_9HELO|nr:hypothetical protein LSUE1_G000885 [Lachnellula suecica]
MKFTTAFITFFAFLPAVLATPTAPHVARTTPTAISVKNFTRTCAEPSPCVYKFVIDYQFGTQWCTTTDPAPAAKSHSWYGIFCEENHTWEISWGWDYQNDFTVMTVVDEPNQYEAFFGYKSPNRATAYPDQGPNTVKLVGT